MRDLIYVFLSGFIALVISARTIPTIINVSRQLKLFAVPNGRSSSTYKIPTLGGISIFLGFVLGLTLTRNGYILPGLTFILAGVIIMFFVGLKDDIVTLSARKKLIAQLITASILIVLGHFRFTNLHGFLGIETIPIWASFLLTGFVFIVFINAFNLIDGIDGLAAGLSMFAASVFGVWFFLSGHTEYSIVSFSLVGSLLGFFFFNVYGIKNKIFMGDTGSLILGTVMGVLVVQFNEFNIDKTVPYAIHSTPAVAFGILIYPLLDTLRVFSIRILQKKSPFHADKNHTHHRLLALGMNHKMATYTILFINMLFTFSVIFLQDMGIVELMIFNFVVGSMLLLFP
ncbi:MAG: undecaprenyl/decaprenyl-phosphate alpha-N-acetylglucosaminyl 1-phosphate transferase, partial [Marinilabiliales bacterium]|nr:undecaprenyl/decaprenyl-phosphate alpha-N-acetylglucosaminyl 1-phosphate transferase [Marinilabiliales bacterium]